MASMNNFYTSSPTVVLPPNPPPEFLPTSHFQSTTTDQTMGDFVNPQTNNERSIASTPGSLAGRKRSRGDIHSPDDEESEFRFGNDQQPSQLPSPPSSRGDPVSGPGNTLIYPNDPAYEAAFQSQSSSIDQSADRKVFELGHIKRPSVAGRKSQRLNSKATVSDDLAQLVLPPNMRDVTNEPLIDEATRALGISWTRMDGSEDLRISQAAYSKWIKNYYPSLTDVSVWFENSAIPGYLVAARNVYNGLQEYYIFSNDLTEARLVTSEPSQLLPRLQMLPALHLAAPGGCIHAETDPITASQNAVDSTLQAEAVNGDISVEPHGLCAAHAMEMD